MKKMDKNEAQYKKMTEEPVGGLILSLAVPTIISMIVTAIYNTADTYFVSQLGTSASGAVGIVMSLMALIQSIGFMTGMGAGSCPACSGRKKIIRLHRWRRVHFILRLHSAFL